MICRKIYLPDQQPHGLMISQVEHARISGLLAEHCFSHFEDSLRQELHQAIIHHDDGWAAWEQQPELDEQGYRPLAFNELPLKDSVRIWEDSIQAAAEIGPRAAWAVAKHFLALLAGSEKPHPAEVEAWQAQMVAKCRQWRTAWRSRWEATEALHWLQLLDALSLWMCSTCTSRNELDDRPAPAYLAVKASPLETEFSFRDRCVRLNPWRFNVTSIEVDVQGWLIPIRKYHDAAELFAARIEQKMRWQLVAD